MNVQYIVMCLRSYWQQIPGTVLYATHTEANAVARHMHDWNPTWTIKVWEVRDSE